METPETENSPECIRQKPKRTAQSGSRPGETCQARPGAYVPIINRNKCEGNGDCVEVCPFGVFEVRRIEDADYSGLSWIGKLKSMAHGRTTAYTPRGDQCQACGLCLAECPERAITLIKRTKT